MTGDRPYWPGMPVDEARARVCAGAGTQFWPPAVAAFVEALDAGEIDVPDAAQAIRPAS